MKTIMGLKIDKREEAAIKTQELLTEYGCILKTRIGLHEASNICSPVGTIILEFIENADEKIWELEKRLQVIEGVHVAKMEL
jgi:hypothetical protein